MEGQLPDEHYDPGRLRSGRRRAHPLLTRLHRVLPPEVPITKGTPQPAEEDRPQNVPENESSGPDQAPGSKFRRGVLRPDHLSLAMPNFYYSEISFFGVGVVKIGPLVLNQSVLDDVSVLN